MSELLVNLDRDRQTSRTDMKMACYKPKVAMAIKYCPHFPCYALRNTEKPLCNVEVSFLF